MTTPPPGAFVAWLLDAVELHRVPGQFHVGLFQGRAVGAHLAERDTVGGEGGHHSFGGQGGDRQDVLGGRGDLGPRVGQDPHRLGAGGGAQPHPVAGCGRDQLGDAGVGDDLAPAGDDEVVGGVLQLAHQVAGDQDGAAFGGQAAQERPHPGDALGVHAVERLVHHQHRAGRRAGRRRCPGAGACRASSRRPCACRTAAEAGQREHLIDPPRGEALGVGEPQQVVAGAAARLQRGRVEQRAEVAERVPQLLVGLAADQRGALVGGVEAEDDAHRGRLARPRSGRRSRSPGRGRR